MNTTAKFYAESQFSVAMSFLKRGYAVTIRGPGNGGTSVFFERPTGLRHDFTQGDHCSRCGSEQFESIDAYDDCKGEF